ncbi:dinitrogenase iron-molybdenum cofactor biosynthesis protein [Pseudothauera lacus]|uniref:Dinitrogenase iron-molybdenum cofactor biosynthesis protein n=1 Tax=Pseudothauera lacus TaxID=2136175 RepID=A0A2T4IIW5_9RHOO|nr:dinitrogenase iron-molybdenum cofactor biosynthesis protein [Pseudothauera lacus]PTD97718.1 dinitrogenase iron-molybdenum cofactor biosynthesis protein [Pseudothauera lacus]
MNAPVPNGSPVSRETALRIAMAARTLPGVNVAAFVHALGERLGLPVTDEKLARMTVADLKAMLQGDEIVDPGVEGSVLKSAVRYLWGEGLADDAPLPDSDVPQGAGALTVAVASNSGEQLDGHFGSCNRFLIYRVAEDGIWLTGVRSTLEADGAEDRNAARAELLAGCQLVYVQSVGGPAAAKVVRAGVHPVKFPAGGAAREVLAQLQRVLGSPPPWLARALGREAQSLARFVPGAEAEAEA